MDTPIETPEAPAKKPRLKKKYHPLEDVTSDFSDSKIDYSDTAPLGDVFLASLVCRPFNKPSLQKATIEVDSDVLMWLKDQGKDGYRRIGTILRAAMLDDLQKLHARAFTN
jgi:uncharacterized protein (DUF4415 family)